MSPEEIEAMEASIPEWKRNALVTTDQAGEAQEDQKGVFGKLKAKIDETEAAKKYYDSDEHQKIKEARENYKEFKGTFKSGVAHSQNPAVQVASSAADLALSQSDCAKAILSM